MSLCIADFQSIDSIRRTIKFLLLYCERESSKNNKNWSCQHYYVLSWEILFYIFFLSTSRRAKKRKRKTDTICEVKKERVKQKFGGWKCFYRLISYPFVYISRLYENPLRSNFLLLFFYVNVLKGFKIIIFLLLRRWKLFKHFIFFPHTKHYIPTSLTTERFMQFSIIWF